MPVASTGSSVAQISVTGNIVTTVTLLPGGTATFIAAAQVRPSATGSLTNTAKVTAPTGDTTPVRTRDGGRPGSNPGTAHETANVSESTTTDARMRGSMRGTLLARIRPAVARLHRLTRFRLILFDSEFLAGL
jgi:hypothetical protein